MKLQDKVRATFHAAHVFNIAAIERGAKIKKSRLFFFLKKNGLFTDAEALSVLTFVRNATRLQK